MKIPSFSFRAPVVRSTIVAFLVPSLVASSAPPGWWMTGTPPVIDPTATPDNRAMASVGQAKWMARNALEALREILPDVAAQVEADLVGNGKPIPSWAVSVTPQQKAAQRAPLLLGQLKSLARPFYDHLHASHASWLAAERIANGTNSAGTHYPWTTTTADDANHAPASIGQLKAVFSLRFETLSTVSHLDSDGDRLTDAEEIALGTDPYSRWSDDDFLDDWLEVVIYGTDPLKEDTDGDGQPDHETIIGSGQTGANGLPHSTYAPTLKWRCLPRRLGYRFSRSEGQLYTSNGLTGGILTNEVVSPGLDLSTLRSILDEKQPYPPRADHPDYTWFSYPVPFHQFSVQDTDTDGTVEIYDQQVYLRGNRPAPAEGAGITRNILVVKSKEKSPTQPPVTLEVISLIIPPGGSISYSRYIGKDFQPVFAGYEKTTLSHNSYTPEFIPSENSILYAYGLRDRAVDNTGSIPHLSVPLNETSLATVLYRDTLYPTPFITSLLEIRAMNRPETVEITTEPRGAGFGVTIKGLQPTGDDPTNIALVIKATGKKIAEIAVRVLEPRTVPISIFRVTDSRIPVTAIGESVTDQEIIDQLNKTFRHQANISFTLDSSSQSIDVKNHNIDVFQEDGFFDLNSQPHRDALLNLTSSIHGKGNKRISIHLFENYKNGTTDHLATQWTNEKHRIFAGKANFPTIIYAHECGHALGLASKPVSPSNRHDLGPWPAEWQDYYGPSSGPHMLVGLMYPQYQPRIQDWIRQEDWQKANDTAKTLE